MANLAPVPPPGLAIFPQYLSTTPQILTIKGSTWSKTMTATLPDNTTLFTIQGETFSRSHRRAIHDSTGQLLFEVRKPTLGTKHYYAEAQENGPRLFETETERKLMHRARTVVTFANVADPARQVVALEYVHPGFGEDGGLALGGRQVVSVEKVSLSLSGEYRVVIAAGVDAALVVGVLVAMVDQAKTRARQGANAGAAGGAGA